MAVYKYFFPYSFSSFTITSTNQYKFW